MAAQIVASVNEVMKYSPTVYCTLHICSTSVRVTHWEKQREVRNRGYGRTPIGTLRARDGGPDSRHYV